MFNDNLSQQILEELKSLIRKTEVVEESKDMYCEFMKAMILNTYSVN